MSTIDPRCHVGETHGIYTLVDVLDEKDKYGHWIYKGVCNVCGREKFSHYGGFSGPKSIVTVCTHVKKYEPKICLYCGKEIPINNLSPSNYNQKKFCDNSCAASYNNIGVRRNYTDGVDYDIKKYCLNCGKEIKYNAKYCSIKCQHEYAQSEWEKKWLSGEISGNTQSLWKSVSQRIRTYLFKKYDNKCARCGWSETNPFTGNIPLEVEHIDGNANNNRPENLTLLCPNCHSLTPTYRGANKGHGRPKTWIPKQS